MKEQHYGNHRRLVPGFHYFTGGLLIICIVLITVYISKNAGTESGLLLGCILLLLAFIIILSSFYARSFALRAQDRAIRAEENLRHFVLTGQLLDQRLQMSQIIALRFANNEEFLELAKRAATEDMNNNEIKKAIQQWKADHLRV